MKLTLVITKHILFKATDQKITKTGISVSYSEVLTPLRAAECLSDLKITLSLKHVLFYFLDSLTISDRVEAQELCHFTNMTQARPLPLSSDLVILSEPMKNTGWLLGWET